MYVPVLQQKLSIILFKLRSPLLQSMTVPNSSVVDKITELSNNIVTVNLVLIKKKTSDVIIRFIFNKLPSG